MEDDMTLTQFLLARIAEDERRAAAAVGRLHARRKDTTLADRAVTEAQSKRRIVEDRSFRESQNADRLSLFGERILGTLAAVYADHPDYDEAWQV